MTANLNQPAQKNKAAESRRYTWRSLTVQLLALVVLPLITLLLAITFGSTALHMNAMRELVGERDEQAVRTAAAAFEDILRARGNELHGLALQAAFAGDLDSAEQVLVKASYLQTSFDAGLAIAAEDGEVIASRGDPGIWELVQPQLADSLTEATRNGSGAALAIQPFHRSAEDSPIMLFVERVPDSLQVKEGQPRQQLYAVGAFYTRTLADQVLGNASTPDRQVSFYLIGPDNALLYYTGPLRSDLILGNHPAVTEARAGSSGTHYLDFDNQNLVIAFSSVASTGWVLLIAEPWEQVVSPVLETTHLAPLVMVPVALLALLALLFGVRQIVQPLQALAGQAGRLGGGDYQAIERPVGGIDEIQQLQSELIHMARVVQAAQRSLHSYIGAITSSQEDERRRLARELHDETIQSLIALKQRIQLAQLDGTDQPDAQTLANLESTTEQVIEDLRMMIRALRPIYLEDLGLTAALHMIASESSQAAGVPVTFESQGSERRFDPPIELALYRIVQEAIRNAVRHAEAAEINVEVSFTPTETVITVTDNGKGFEKPRSSAEFAAEGHFGLLGMQERAELIGAQLQVQSTIGRGTRVIVRLAG